jgi:hypothetical protein
MIGLCEYPLLLCCCGEVWQELIGDVDREFPVPSYNVKFFGSPEEEVEVEAFQAVEELDVDESKTPAEQDKNTGEPAVTKHVVHFCLPSSSSSQVEAGDAGSPEIYAHAEFVVGEGEEREVVRGLVSPFFDSFLCFVPC